MQEDLGKDYVSSLNRAIFLYHEIHPGKWPDLILVTPPFYCEVLPYLRARQNKRYREDIFDGIRLVQILGDDPDFFLAEQQQIYFPPR